MTGQRPWTSLFLRNELATIDENISPGIRIAKSLQVRSVNMVNQQLGIKMLSCIQVAKQVSLGKSCPSSQMNVIDLLVGIFTPDHTGFIKGILATPPRNKGLIAGLIKGNQWLINP